MNDKLSLASRRMTRLRNLSFNAYGGLPCQRLVLEIVETYTCLLDLPSFGWSGEIVETYTYLDWKTYLFLGWIGLEDWWDLHLPWLDNLPFLGWIGLEDWWVLHLSWLEDLPCLGWIGLEDWWELHLSWLEDLPLHWLDWVRRLVRATLTLIGRPTFGLSGLCWKIVETYICLDWEIVETYPDLNITFFCDPGLDIGWRLLRPSLVGCRSLLGHPGHPQTSPIWDKCF